MYLTRKIDQSLLEWINLPNRKPLLLRGARQVGKTSTVHQLAKQFQFFLPINFDERKSLVRIFDNAEGVKDVCEQLSILTNTPIIHGRTLLFLDEIQAAPSALRMLRYFHEKMPDLHVIAAGSLLEFALEDLPSFATGRVRSLFMYPLSFPEFLNANGEKMLLEKLNQAGAGASLPDSLHQKLIGLLKKFLITGGMPEAVSAYVSGGNLLEVQRILNDLLMGLQADFAKYKRKVPGERLSEVFRSVAGQTGNKFSYKPLDATLHYKQIKDALQLLSMAGIIHPVVHSSGNGIPLGAEVNPKKTKFLVYDTGIFQRLLGLDLQTMLTDDNFDAVNKGNIAELFVGLEILKAQDPYEQTHLHYWHRESRNSQAEVDYLLQVGGKIAPVEVKAGTRGGMQSMFLFLKEKKQPKGYRLSLENFSSMDSVDILPFYAAYKLIGNPTER